MPSSTGTSTPPPLLSQAGDKMGAKSAADMLSPELVNEVRLLGMLARGLANKASCAYSNTKNHSSLLLAMQHVPGSSFAGKIWNAGEASVASIAQLFLSINVVKNSLDKLDRVTSRQLVYVLARAAEELDEDGNITDEGAPNPLLRSLLNFLRSLAEAGGAWEGAPEQKRSIASLLASPDTRSSMQREDELVARISMMQKEIEHFRSELEAALQRSAHLERLLENEKAEKSELNKALLLAESSTKCLETSLLQSRALEKSIQLKLDDAERAVETSKNAVREAREQRSSLAESVSSLMGKIEKQEAQALELQSVKSDLAAAKIECSALRKQSDVLKAEVAKGLSMNKDLMNELAKTEQNLIDVQSFMRGEHGEKMKRLEYDLAQSRLELAQCESEKDDLEQEIGELKSILSGVRFSNKQTLSQGEFGKEGAAKW